MIYKIQCIGGPKDGTEFELNEDVEKDYWDKVTLLKNQGLHPGFRDTEENPDRNGWYFYNEEKNALVYKEFEDGE